jgi:hypothetical protein
VKAKGGGRIAEERMGPGFISILATEEHRER